MRYAHFGWHQCLRNERQVTRGQSYYCFCYWLNLERDQKKKKEIPFFCLLNYIIHYFPSAFSTTPCLLVEMHPNLHHDKLGRVGVLIHVDWENEPLFDFTLKEHTVKDRILDHITNSSQCDNFHGPRSSCRKPAVSFPLISWYPPLFLRSLESLCATDTWADPCLVTLAASLDVLVCRHPPPAHALLLGSMSRYRPCPGGRAQNLLGWESEP